MFAPRGENPAYVATIARETYAGRIVITNIDVKPRIERHELLQTEVTTDVHRGIRGRDAVMLVFSRALRGL